jgi:hypothetical protein
MSTERRESDLIRSWLDESYEAERDPRDYLDHLLDEVPETPQRRRRWWPFPLLRREAQPPTATVTDTSENQPNPSTASNGHAPTVIGRTQSMLSPAKAITAGALVFAIGGAFLIAQPLGQQANVPGAEAGAASETVAFGASYAFSSMRPGEVSTLADGTQRTAGEAWVFRSIESSDPRFEGDLVVNATYDKYDEVQLTTHILRIENESGAWQNGPFVRMTWTDRQTPGDAYVEAGETEQQEWVGEGDYEGLVAVVVSTEEQSGGGRTVLEGYVVDGALPPAPEPYSPADQN